MEVAVSDSEPHAWNINITCPKCRHIGDVEVSFPCCEHAAEARAEVDQLADLYQDIGEELFRAADENDALRAEVERWKQRHLEIQDKAGGLDANNRSLKAEIERWKEEWEAVRANRNLLASLLQTTEARVATLEAALCEAQPFVCSLGCPSVWRTADKSQPHAKQCSEIRALIDRPEAQILPPGKPDPEGRCPVGGCRHFVPYAQWCRICHAEEKS